VVRDKKGVLLRDLVPSEVDVFEDGVRQDVESVELVEQPSGVLAGAMPDSDPARASSPPPAATPPTFVALVFDRLSPAARAFAQQAVERHLEVVAPGRAWFAAFAVDRGLATLQPFTADRAALRSTVQGLASRSATPYSGLRDRETIRTAYAGLAEGIGQAHVASAEIAGTPECRAVEDDVHRRLEIMDSRLKESYDSLERDEQGLATAHALLALVDGLSKLPGRKAVLFFSEGLVVPTRAEASFRAVVSAATRGRVSVYGIDASGLQATSPGDETRRTIDVLQTRLKPEETERVATRGPSSGEGPKSRLALLEKNEDALRFSSESALGRLADETGGFFIRGTNDLAPELAKVDEELNAYYLLTYAPKNQAYDGRFRTITVKLRRSHGRLQARQGYLALKTPLAVLDHEAPALARLESEGPLPAAVPLRLGGLQFPLDPGLATVPVVVEVPAAGLRAVTDKKTGTFRQDLTIVALVRDQGGAVVAKMSQRYPRTGPIARLDAERSADLHFYRETRLPAGSYTLEAVAYDALGGAAGAVRAKLQVPAALEGRLRASSLMVVRSAEKLPPEAGARPRPLQYQDVLLYPNLDRPVRRETGKGLTFFVTAWPSQERPEVEAQVEVVRDGRRVATTPPAHLRPDGDGRIQLASSLPLEGFSPGAYELRVTLSDGQDAETRTASLPITN
jgi:VWFA-related protein